MITVQSPLRLALMEMKIKYYRTIPAKVYYQNFARVCENLHKDALVTWDRDVVPWLLDEELWIENCSDPALEQNTALEPVWWWSPINVCWNMGHARFYNDPFPHWVVVRHNNKLIGLDTNYGPVWRGGSTTLDFVSREQVRK